MTNKVLNIFAIVAGLGMTLFGANKFFHFIPMPELTPAQMETMGHFMGIKWLMPLVGVVEFLGGLTFANPKTRALGAIILFPILVGIVLHGLTMDNGGWLMGLVFFIIDVAVIVRHKNQYLPMIQS